MSLDSRLRRLEEWRSRLTVQRPQIWMLGADGNYRCGATGEMLSAAEFDRQCPDARVFTLSLGDTVLDDQEDGV